MLVTDAAVQLRPSLPARFLASGFNVNVLRTNTLLHKDEWEQLDQTVVNVSADILNGIADLEAMGLVHPLGSLGVLMSQYEKVSDMSDANVNMAADADDEEDRVDFPLVNVPVPIISKPFRIDIRHLAASRQMNSMLDMTHVETATRKVAEKLEQILFTGSTVVVQGNPIYGYMNHPDRNTETGADWGTATNIIPNVVAMIGDLYGDNFYGPFRLYLNPTQFAQTIAVNVQTDKTALRVIEEMPGFGPGSVKPSFAVTAGQGVLACMRRDVVDLARAQDILPVEWEEKGGLVTRWKVLTAQIPRVKSDQQGRCGVCHISSI